MEAALWLDLRQRRMTLKNLSVPERLIVAADFRPPEDITWKKRLWVREKVLMLARNLQGIGVFIKINSALRACGYDLIDEIHRLGLLSFADLKFYDTGKTLSTDGALICEAQPDILTVACSTGETAMCLLKRELPNTEVLGVTVLTTFERRDALLAHGDNVAMSVRRLAFSGARSGVDGLVCSAKEVEMLRLEFGDRFTLNTPAVRSEEATVFRDDQNPERIMTPSEAIKTGADRVIVGRPILRAKNPRETVMRVLDEIEQAVTEVAVKL